LAPDLILTDIHMPEAKGTDICRVLKHEYDTQDIPIVLFSSLSDEELGKLASRSAPTGTSPRPTDSMPWLQDRRAR
jgi:CheY-like chemotaxis protein